MTPPMMEWVVETGMPSLVAIVRQQEEAMTAQTMPNMSIAGSSLNRDVSTILVRIVSATRAPTPTDPANSMRDARIMA